MSGAEKSTTMVVPPRRAARLPVAKSSAVTVPATSRSKWVWPSIKPGKRSFPVQSTTVSAAASRPAPTAAMVSPSRSTSAMAVPWPETTVPPFNKVFIADLLLMSEIRAPETGIFSLRV